jgi:outer membrane murein-binding lipoprotein Lpp
MESISTTAENASLFAIDKELEAAFDAASAEEEQTGAISEETKQRCLDLFAELGKKVDRIAGYVRATEFRAKAARDEAARLAARQKSTEGRVTQVKGMLAYFMQARGLKRLEGELNTIRLQKNSQATLTVDPLALPGSYFQTTITLTQEDWVHLLEVIASPELKSRLEAVTKHEPNERLVRAELEAGKDIPGALLVKGSHIRFS